MPLPESSRDCPVPTPPRAPPKPKKKPRRNTSGNTHADNNPVQRERTLLDDRLWGMVADGTLDLLDDGRPAAAVSLTWPELAALLARLSPAVYAGRPEAPEPTDTPPGSAARVEVYRRRHRAGYALFHRGDSAPTDRRGMRPATSAGGQSGRETEYGREAERPGAAGWQDG